MNWIKYSFCHWIIYYFVFGVAASVLSYIAENIMYECLWCVIAMIAFVAARIEYALYRHALVFMASSSNDSHS